ncbi:phosphatase PAP2 family protein [Specibacter sp. RAF43]|uniref:phosphatase PAP2 family protein n=1 Tax=Specibacter sp. RAF43 TaxID=3233057 RepID=UPI003F99AE83
MHRPDGETRHSPGARPGERTRLARLPQPRRWILWVLALSAAVVALGFFAMDTPGFSTNEFGLDTALSHSHSAVPTAIALAINVLFAPAAGLAAVVLIGAVLLFVRREPVNALAFCGVAIAGWGSSQVFKLIVGRQRPNPALLFDPLAPETGSNSFPSGHVALTVALAWAVYFLARNTRWAKAAAVAGPAAAIVVAWSRLYIGVHYPSDVAASFLAATAFVILFAGLWNTYQGRLLPRIPLLGRFGPLTATTSATH